MKKVIGLICIIPLLLLTNCNQTLMQVDEPESTITETMTTIDTTPNESPTTSIVLSDFGDVKEITVSQYINEIELPFDSDSMNNLKNIYVHEDNETFYDIDGVLFIKETSILLYYPKGKTDTHYTIPEGTKIIGSYAFSGNHNLTSLSFAESVERIEKYVIYKCDSISSISIHSIDTIISNISFVYEYEDERVFCEKLKSISFNFGKGEAFEMLENKVGDIYSYVTAIFPKKGVEYIFVCYYLPYPDDDTLESFIYCVSESQTGSLMNGNNRWDGERVIYGDFEVVEYKQEIHIWNYTGNESHVIIPETINGKPVTQMVKWILGYENDFDIKELTIPMYLSETAAIYLSPGADRGMHAFFPTLENIYVDKDNPYLYSIDGVLFSYDNAKLLYCPDRYETYEVPDGTKTIARDTFSYNKLKELSIPTSVEIIESFILEYCEEITTIRLPDKFINIAQSAFDYSWNFGTYEIYLNQSIQNIYINTELSTYENEVEDFFKYFFDRFRIVNVTVHFKDYKFTYADYIISKYSVDDNKLIEKYDCNKIRILNTVERAKKIYKESEARVFRLVDLTFDGIPELFLGYGLGTGQSYSIYDISYIRPISLLNEEKAFTEFHYYINTLTSELVCIVTETEFPVDNGRSEQALQIVTNPIKGEIGKMIILATVYNESSVEYKINRNLTNIGLSECETVTQEVYDKFMEDYYSSFEEVTYPSVTKVIDLFYWDDTIKETVEITPEEISNTIDEAYNEYIILYEAFVQESMGQ